MVPMDTARGQSDRGTFAARSEPLAHSRLVIEHMDEGALGLDPEPPVGDERRRGGPQLESLVELGDQLDIGRAGSALIGDRRRASSRIRAMPRYSAFDDVGVLGAGAAPEDASASLRSGRAFVGHAGLGPEPARRRDRACGDRILEPARLQVRHSPTTRRSCGHRCSRAREETTL